MTADKVRVAVIGAAGYTGSELLRYLAQHKHFELSAVYGKSTVGKRVDSLIPSLRGRCDLVVESPDSTKVEDKATLVFSCLPHRKSAETVSALVTGGMKVVDLSADFRLKDVDSYESWYGVTHPAKNLVSEAAYGLPEWNREAITKAHLVACPGCYPTAMQLAAVPIARAGLIDSSSVLVVDAKSGVTGAGKSPGPANHFCEVGESFRAYKAGGIHRHSPEMEQGLSLFAETDAKVIFTPHLIPMSRGILATMYVTADSGAQVHDALVKAYQAEVFVDVLPLGETPSTASVRGSNIARIGCAFDERTKMAVVVSVIDNLGKGASGQAVQCANLMMGFDESHGLLAPPLYP